MAGYQRKEKAMNRSSRLGSNRLMGGNVGQQDSAKGLKSDDGHATIIPVRAIGFVTIDELDAALAVAVG